MFAYVIIYILLTYRTKISPMISGEVYRQNYLAADHRRVFVFFFIQNYLAADHRPVFGFFFIQTELPRRWSPASLCFLLYTELPRRWSPASFGFLLYTDRITSPLITGEFLVSSLYRQNYLAADHRRVFAIFSIQTELSRRWSSASFWYLLYTERITSPLIIGEEELLYKSQFNFSIFILRTWRNFCRSVYWKSHIICVCVNADRWL